MSSRVGLTHPTRQPLTLASVDPPSAYRGENTTLTLVGTGFDDSVSVLIGKTALDTVTRKSAAVVTCVVPKGAFAVGKYDVTVVNSDGTRASLTEALQVFEGVRVKSGCSCNQAEALVPLVLLALGSLRRRRR